MGREARSAQGVHHAAAIPGSDHFAQHGFLIAKGDEVNLGVALEWLAVAAPWAIRVGALIVVGLVTVLCRSPISLCHLGFECEGADATQI